MHPIEQLSRFIRDLVRKQLEAYPGDAPGTGAAPRKPARDPQAPPTPDGRAMWRYLLDDADADRLRELVRAADADRPDIIADRIRSARASELLGALGLLVVDHVRRRHKEGNLTYCSALQADLPQTFKYLQQHGISKCEVGRPALAYWKRTANAHRKLYVLAAEAGVPLGMVLRTSGASHPFRELALQCVRDVAARGYVDRDAILSHFERQRDALPDYCSSEESREQLCFLIETAWQARDEADGTPSAGSSGTSRSLWSELLDALRKEARQQARSHGDRGAGTIRYHLELHVDGARSRILATVTPPAALPAAASGIDASGIDASGIDASGIDASGTSDAGIHAGHREPGRYPLVLHVGTGIHVLGRYVVRQDEPGAVRADGATQPEALDVTDHPGALNAAFARLERPPGPDLELTGPRADALAPLVFVQAAPNARPRLLGSGDVEVSGDRCHVVAASDAHLEMAGVRATKAGTCGARTIWQLDRVPDASPARVTVTHDDGEATIELGCSADAVRRVVVRSRCAARALFAWDTVTPDSEIEVSVSGVTGGPGAHATPTGLDVRATPSRAGAGPMRRINAEDVDWRPLRQRHASRPLADATAWGRGSVVVRQRDGARATLAAVLVPPDLEVIAEETRPGSRKVRLEVRGLPPGPLNRVVVEPGAHTLTSDRARIELPVDDAMVHAAPFTLTWPDWHGAVSVTVEAPLHKAGFTERANDGTWQTAATELTLGELQRVYAQPEPLRRAMADDVRAPGARIGANHEQRRGLWARLDARLVVLDRPPRHDAAAPAQPGARNGDRQRPTSAAQRVARTLPGQRTWPIDTTTTMADRRPRHAGAALHPGLPLASIEEELALMLRSCDHADARIELSIPSHRGDAGHRLLVTRHSGKVEVSGDDVRIVLPQRLRRHAHNIEAVWFNPALPIGGPRPCTISDDGRVLLPDEASGTTGIVAAGIPDTNVRLRPALVVPRALLEAARDVSAPKADDAPASEPGHLAARPDLLSSWQQVSALRARDERIAAYAELLHGWATAAQTGSGEAGLARLFVTSLLVLLRYCDPADLDALVGLARTPAAITRLLLDGDISEQQRRALVHAMTHLGTRWWTIPATLWRDALRGAVTAADAAPPCTTILQELVDAHPAIVRPLGRALTPTDPQTSHALGVERLTMHIIERTMAQLAAEDRLASAATGDTADDGAHAPYLSPWARARNRARGEVPDWDGAHADQLDALRARLATAAARIDLQLGDPRPADAANDHDPNDATTSAVVDTLERMKPDAATPDPDRIRQLLEDASVIAAHHLAGEALLPHELRRALVVARWLHPPVFDALLEAKVNELCPAQ